jgi:hypothetical protein
MKTNWWSRLFALWMIIRAKMATIGPKPNQERVVSMLLSLVDLPGSGWTMVNEYTARTFTTRKAGEVGRRLHEVRSITAWRCFDTGVPRRSVQISLTPYASPEDARSSLSSVLGLVGRKPLTHATITEARIVEGMDVLGVDEVLAYEEHFVNRQGSGVSRVVAGTIEEIRFMIGLAALDDEWSWGDMTSIASTQVEKIKRALSAERMAS